MRRGGVGAVLAVTVALCALTWPVQAQVRPENTLVSGTTIMYPGAEVTRCFDIDAGTLSIAADSPPGRTGESAFLDVTASTVGGESTWLHTLVTMAPADTRYSVEARYPVEFGRYCITLSVTKTVEDTGDPNRPERSNKQVYLEVKHRPQ